MRSKGSRTKLGEVTELLKGCEISNQSIEVLHVFLKVFTEVSLMT